MESGWQRAPELLETETEKFKPCFVTSPRLSAQPKVEVQDFAAVSLVIPSQELCGSSMVIQSSMEVAISLFMMVCGTWTFPNVRTEMEAKLRLLQETNVEKLMLQLLLL